MSITKYLLMIALSIVLNQNLKAAGIKPIEKDSLQYQIPNLEMLDSVVGYYRVFFTGENHYFSKVNNSIKMQMLKYLHEHRGVKDLVIELGYSRGYIVDRYINDDSTFYNLLSRTTGKVYLEFYSDLRAWNQTLPIEERIHVHGVDVERFPDDAPILMADILQKDSNKMPKHLEFFSEVLASYAEYKQTKQVYNYDNVTDDFSSSYTYVGNTLSDSKTIDTLISEYKYLREDYKAFLGQSFEVFDRAMVSLQQYRKYMKYERMPHQYVYRERFMFENMAALLNEDSSRTLYGQFGRCHIGVNQVINDCEWYNQSPLARRINQSEYKGQVLNIAIFYSSQYISSDFSSLQYTHIYDYRDSMDGHICKLFNIEEDTSFKKNYQYLILYNPNKQIVKNKNLKRAKLLSDMVFSYDFIYGQSTFNFNNLSVALDPTGNKKFSNTVQCLGLGFSIYADGVYNSFYAMGYDTYKLSVDNYKYNLTGQSYVDKIGVYTRFSRHFTFAPNLQIAYARFKLDIENDSIPSFVVPGFTQVKDSKYANGALMFGGGMNMKIALGVWAINLDGFVLADVSKKYWRRVESGWNTLDTNSPRTSMFHYGFSVGISALLYENYAY